MTSLAILLLPLRQGDPLLRRRLIDAELMQHHRIPHAGSFFRYAEQSPEQHATFDRRGGVMIEYRARFADSGGDGLEVFRLHAASIHRAQKR